MNVLVFEFVRRSARSRGRACPYAEPVSAVLLGSPIGGTSVALGAAPVVEYVEYVAPSSMGAELE